jgi:hypothetical protein
MWARQIARRTGWSHNPLRRTSDRVEAWATMVLIVAMVLIAPWLAAKAAHGTYRDDIRTTAYEEAHNFAVGAVLLEDAAWHADSTQDDRPPLDFVPTLVRWSFRDGVARTGTVLAHVGQRAGSTMVIWVDDRGVLSGPPGHRSPRMDAALAAVLTVCAVAGGLAVVHGLIRWMLTRHRLRSWQTEWTAVDRRWSDR